MVTYPIQIKGSTYRGTDPKKRLQAIEKNRIAINLENYINQLITTQENPIQVYTYYEIAEETGHSIDIVKDLCFSIDSGHHGFTAIKRGLTYEQALKLNATK